MTATHHLPPTAEHKIPVSLAVTALSASRLGAETPKFHICTRNGLPMEEQRKEQMFRLAREYNRKKYTITRGMIIDRGAIHHSSPALTPNLRFLDNDDLGLSTYVHARGYWRLWEPGSLGEPENLGRFDDVQHTLRDSTTTCPKGTVNCKAVISTSPRACSNGKLWKNFVGAERAGKVMEWKQRDHYKAIYALIPEQREQRESVLNRNGVRCERETLIA